MEAKRSWECVYGELADRFILHLELLHAHNWCRYDKGEPMAVEEHHLVHASLVGATDEVEFCLANSNLEIQRYAASPFTSLAAY